MNFKAEIKQLKEGMDIKLRPLKSTKLEAQIEKLKELTNIFTLFLYLMLALVTLTLVILIVTNSAKAEVLCGPQTGLYPFAVVNCEEYTWGVDTSKPLCEQEKWKHLSNYDHRCYKLKEFKECARWDCPVPYDKVLVEPITGATKVIPGSREEMDYYYRLLRQRRGRLRK